MTPALQEAPTTQSASENTQIEQRPVIVRSEELLGDARELWIEHGDSMYRLRRTGSGKLYLTK